jgi:hypothetical protein
LLIQGQPLLVLGVRIFPTSRPVFDRVGFARMRTAMCSFRRLVPLLALSILAPLALTGAEAPPFGQRQFASQTAAP